MFLAVMARACCHGDKGVANLRKGDVITGRGIKRASPGKAAKLFADLHPGVQLGTGRERGKLGEALPSTTIAIGPRFDLKYSVKVWQELPPLINERSMALIARFAQRPSPHYNLVRHTIGGALFGSLFSYSSHSEAL